MTDPMRGLILYGPPAAGKDTITRALQELDPRYRLFPRLKAGEGRTAGYRMATEAELDALRANGEVVWENRRYGATYVIDRPELVRRLREEIPVVHLGQVDAIDAVIRAAPQAKWLIVYVYCSREVAGERIAARGTGDDEARLRAWDETPPADAAHLAFDTGTASPNHVATRLHRYLGWDSETESPLPEQA